MQNTKLFAALIVILGLAAGYMYYSQIIVPNELAVPAPVTSRDSLSAYKNLNIDFSTFDNAAYKALAVYGQVPVSPGVTGKKDVFAP